MRTLPTTGAGEAASPEDLPGVRFTGFNLLQLLREQQPYRLRRTGGSLPGEKVICKPAYRRTPRSDETMNHRR
jgi:hypothetical protein